MTCSLHQAILPKGHGVSVNGVTIPRDLIAREVQYHPSRAPSEAWKAAARALAVRELLLQEARRLDVSGKPIADGEGRRETDDEAAIRTLVAQEVRTPQADSRDLPALLRAKPAALPLIRHLRGGPYPVCRQQGRCAGLCASAGDCRSYARGLA